MFDDEAIDGDTLVCEQREHKWMKLRESTTLYAYVTGGGGGGEPLQQTFPTHVQRTEEIDNGAERATRRVTPPERAPNNAEVKFDEVRETYVYYDDSEEIYFEWDADRKAWIPVVCQLSSCMEWMMMVMMMIRANIHVLTPAAAA